MMEDDNQMIRTLLAAPPPSARATTAARRQLTDAIAGRGQSRRRRPSWRLSLAGSGLAAVAAAGVALALAVGGPAGLGATGSGGAPGVAAPPAGPQADAAAPQLLLAAAERAEGTAGTGRYWLVAKVTEGALYLPVHVKGETFYVSERWITETWTPRDQDGQAWQGRQSLGYQPRTAEDEAAWKRAGSPRSFDLGPADTTQGGRVIRRMGPGKAELTRSPGGRDYASTYGPIGLADLPTDPARLRTAVDTLIRQRGAEPTDAAVFALLGDLLTEAPAQPRLRAAAFTVLSTLSGVVNVGPRADVTGREGVALELKQTAGQPGGGTFVDRSWLILDPRTYQLLGGGMQGAMAGRDGKPDITRGGKESSAAVVTAQWTDQRPVAPHGY